VDATHDIDDSVHQGCGHAWTITVVARDYYNPSKRQLTREHDLHHALDQLLAPLWGRSLNTMLLGASPTPEGIATWVSEQLINMFPDITQVDVEASYGEHVSFHRELRRVGSL
jgi:hypothetical protein